MEIRLQRSERRDRAECPVYQQIADQIRRQIETGALAEGDRLPPIHTVRCGDPLKPSVYDFYSVTKTRAERAVIESGLEYWASIRQTYIAIGNPLSLMDPIMFHQPLTTCIEMVTDEDAGYGLVQCLECPDDFYGRIYKMGGGPASRVAYHDYLDRLMQLLELGDLRRIVDRDWICLRNFHCSYFEDSGVLNDYLGHWRQSLDDHLRQVVDEAPWYGRLAMGEAYDAGEFLDTASYQHVNRWAESIKAREPVQKGLTAHSDR